MTYFPTIELDGQTLLLLSRGALRLQPGQWVRSKTRGRGRYLRTNPRTGSTSVCWVRPGEDFDAFTQRFHRACMKGFVGRYAPRYEAAKALRDAAKRMRELDLEPAPVR